MSKLINIFRHLKSRVFLLIGVGVFTVVSCGKKEPVQTPENQGNDGQSSRVIPGLEKTDLTLGIIPKLFSAPVIVAQERGLFRDEGLTVTLERQESFELAGESVISGELDGAVMSVGQLMVGAARGDVAGDLRTAYSLGYSGSGIVVSEALWERMEPGLLKDAEGHWISPVTADRLKVLVQEANFIGDPIDIEVSSPVSGGHYLTRYWLAAAGIHPGFFENFPNPGKYLDAEVAWSAGESLLPAQDSAVPTADIWLAENLLSRGSGTVAITSDEIWRNHPDGVFAVSKEWSEQHPKAWLAVTKALIRAGAWLDESLENRREAARVLSQTHYLDLATEGVEKSLTGTVSQAEGRERERPDLHVFFRYHASFPYASDGVWFLTQMIRWGQLAGQRPETWFEDLSGRVYQREIYIEAARMLIEQGLFSEADFDLETDGYRHPTADFIDAYEYDGKKPNEYLSGFGIGLK